MVAGCVRAVRNGGAVRESLPPLPPMDIHPPTSTTAIPVPTLATTSRCTPAVSLLPIPPLSPLPPFQIPHLPFPFAQATSYVQAFLRPKPPPCPLVRMGSRSPPPLERWLLSPRAHPISRVSPTPTCVWHCINHISISLSTCVYTLLLFSIHLMSLLL
jgi:hypothetical protein